VGLENEDVICINSDPTKPKMLMLATAIIAVTAVGVSTAQVVNTLSLGSLNPTFLESPPDTDLAVTIRSIPKSKKRILTLENLKSEVLTIRNLNYEIIGHTVGFEQERTESITLRPSQQVALVIDGPSSPQFESRSRLVSMKGRVVDGHLVVIGE